MSVFERNSEKKSQQENEKKKKKNVVRNLGKGDFFGEVSLLFSCRRSATVKPKQYCEAAYLAYKDFKQLTSNHKVVENYFIENSDLYLTLQLDGMVGVIIVCGDPEWDAERWQLDTEDAILG